MRNAPEPMKKLITLTAILACINFAMSQNIVKDTIFLKEVVTKAKQKKKLLNYEISGNPAYNGLDYGTGKVVCLLDNLPSGKIKSVTFYLNTGLPNLFKSKLKINYKDVLLGIIICEVDEKGKPGKVITENEVKFMVSADHRGSLTVNLSSLNLESAKMFFGFTILSEVSKTESNLYMRFCEDENARMYQYMSAYNSDKKNWYQVAKQSFKLKMKIEQ